MSRYIVMGRDECGDEFRPDSLIHSSMAKASATIPSLREDYQEARRLWAEEFKDKEYYMNQKLKNEEYDYE